MRIHKIVLIGAMALAGIPAGALAATASHPTTPASTNANPNANGTTTTTTPVEGKSGAARVQFVLRGTLSAYTAANGATNGTISVTVTKSNHDSKALKGTTLVFVVTSDTKVLVHDNATIAASGDNGIVKVRAAKNTSTWTGLTASQVIDKGAPSS